jgi:hypothetical protein
MNFEGLSETRLDTAGRQLAVERQQTSMKRDGRSRTLDLNVKLQLEVEEV